MADVSRVTGGEMTILVVSNQKGGVGKTTTAISLGAAMVGRGQRVLLVDLDPQANATSGLGISKERANGIYGVLLRERPLGEAIVPTALSGLDLVPSGPDMAGAEVELVPVMAREYRLRGALRDATSYDTVIIDCPPSLGLLTINALAAGDGVVVPVQCEYYALEGLAQLLNTIEAVRERLNDKLEVLAIVLTMEDRRNRLSMQVIDEVRKHFPKLVAKTRVPRTVRLAEAPSHGQPISVYDPQSRGAKAYDELAREVLARLKAREPIALSGAIA
jgi:chromosome partitioning protein